MGIFIFLNPFPHTTAVKEICFYGSVTIILILICFWKIDISFRSPLTIPFYLFALWVFIGLFFALDKENSIHDYLTHLLKYIIFYYIMINYFYSKERLFYISLIIMVSSGLFSIGNIVYFYLIMGKSFSTKLMDSPEVAVNLVSILMIPAIVFSLHNIITDNRISVKVLSYMCLFSTSFICFMTRARSTILALFLACTIIFFKKKKFMIVCIGVILFSTIILSINNRFTKENPFTSLRLDIHFITYEIIKDYPLIGIGYGMETYGNRKYIDLEAYQERVPEKYRGGTLHTDPHSLPFSITVRTGLIGLVLYLYILFASFKMCWFSIKQGENDLWGRALLSIFVAILFVGLFEPLHRHVLDVVFFTLLAMITINWKLRNVETIDKSM